MEIPPLSMKLAGHANKWLAQGAHITRDNRKVCVAPFTTAERLDLKMRIRLDHTPVTRANMACIIKDRTVGTVASHKLRHSELKAVDDLHAKALALNARFRIHALLHHLANRHRVRANVRHHDVKKYALDIWKGFKDIAYDFAHIFFITGVHREEPVEAALEFPRPAQSAFFVHDQPFRMFTGNLVVELHGQIHCRANTRRATGVKLLTQKIPAIQMRMHQIGKTPALIIKPAMMTAAKKIDRIDVSATESLHKDDRIKVTPDIFKRLTGMVVQVNLTVWKLKRITVRLIHGIMAVVSTKLKPDATDGPHFFGKSTIIFSAS